MTRAAERAPLLPTTASAKASTRAVGAATSAASMMTAISIEGVDGAGDGADVAWRRARGNARGVKVALVIGSAAAVCAVAFAGVSVRGHETRVAGLGRFRLSHASRAALAKSRRHERVEERHAEARAENARTLEASTNGEEREEGEDTVSDVQKMIREAIARVRGAVQAGEAVDTSKGSNGKEDGLPALEFDVRHYVKQSDDDGARVGEKKAKDDDGEDEDRDVRAELSKGDEEKRSKKHKREDDEDEEDSDSDEDDDDDDARKSRALVRKQLVNADETFAKVEFTPYKTKRVSADVRARADEKLAELAEESNELLLEIQQRMNMRIEAIERDASEVEDVDERVRAQQVAAEKIEELREEVRKRVVVIKQKTAMRAAAIKDEIEAEIENKNNDTAQLAKGDDAETTTDEDGDERKLTPHIIEANIDALKKQIEKDERVQENILKAKKRVEDNAEDLSDHQRKRREAVEDRQERIEDDNAKEKKNKEAREDRLEEHEEKREAAEDEATAAMVDTLKELRVALAEATDKPLSDIVKKFDVPSTLEKLKENKKEADHEAKDAKEDAAYEEKIDSLKQRIKELEDRLDDALNGHEFNDAFFRKRPVGLEPDFPAKHSYDESGGFFQCEEENKCMTKVTLYKHNGKLYGMKGHCEKGTKATDLGTGEHEVFPKHAEFDFSAEQCNVNFDKHYRSLYIRREGDDVIAMSTDGTPATRCGLDIPSATSVKFECQNPKACITGFHVKNRYTNIDGSVERTAEDLSISDVDFVCSDGRYAVDPLLQRDDYGEITVMPQFTVGVAHTPSGTGTRKTVMPYLQLKTHSVVSATVGQKNMLVTQIRDITHMSDKQKTGWCTTQHAQAWLNAAPSCPDGSKLCAKPSFLYNPPGSEYRLKYGHQLFNVTSAETHESTHIVLTNNEDPALDGRLPVKANEEFFKFGHVYEICASAVDYSGFSSNITNDAGEILGTMSHRRLDGDVRFVGLSNTGERSISMKGGSRHYIAHAPEAPTDEELEKLGCAVESSSCVISGGGVKLSKADDDDDKAAATGYNEDMKMYHSMPSSNFDPLAELSESERAKIIAKQSEETLSARERLEQQLAARGVNIDLDVHEK